MHTSRADLADFVYFLAIARHRSFSRAAKEIGVSASALSHAIKALEERLSIRLFNRTNRSVTLTAAGNQLQLSLAGPFSAIDDALEMLNQHRDSPSGRIRLNVVRDSVPLLLGPTLKVFNDRYPQIEVEVVSSNRMVDVIDGGFDAGIRYGGTVPEDMIAQRLSPDMRWMVAGSPAYLARHGVPLHPDDLLQHQCVRFRLGNDRLYDWELEKDGQVLEVEVPGSLIIDDSRLSLALLLEGAGLVYLPEPLLTPLTASGQAQLVLQDWASPGPGFHMYYSSRRQLPAGLRLLIDLIRELSPLGA
ncbi:LysR family transcriptional regulator [Stenotrophomonas sp. 3(2025)]|uniref:LysR family transcriptional regulator n=1 Tax=Stenotrophomonas sp. 3(2025) TaxID=3456023 RepID=UPI004043C234